MYPDYFDTQTTLISGHSISGLLDVWTSSLTLYSKSGNRGTTVIVLTRFGMQGLAQHLTGFEIAVKVKIHFVYIFLYLWYIFCKMLEHLWHSY